MDRVERFVQAENIRTLSEKLCAELHPEKRDLLTRLLVEEENRFGLNSWHFDMAQHYIRDGSARVEKLGAVIGRMHENGQDVALANKLLENFMITLDLFHEFSRRAAIKLENSKI
jgi:hypothetical protein